MLQQLFIQNYALIESLNLTLEDGLTVITGETGAGKSIILGAVHLLLGQRADVKSLFDKAPLVKRNSKRLSNVPEVSMLKV